MIYIVIIFLFVFAIFGAVREGSFLNLQSMFCFMWASICYAASLHLYGMREYNDFVYLIVCIGCAGFSFGYFSQKAPCRNEIISALDDNYIINDRPFNILYYITTIFMVYFAIKVIFLLRAGVPYYIIRDMFGSSHEDSMLTNKFEFFIQDFFLYALVPVFLLLLGLHLLKLITLSKQQIVKILILGISFIFVSGARIALVNLLFQLFVIFFAFKIHFGKKYALKIIAVFIILMTCVDMISKGREVADAQVYVAKEQTYYQDFALAIPMCDYYVELCDKNQDATYGAMFISGFANLLFRPIGMLGVQRPDILKLVDKYNNYINEYIDIFADGGVNNAYASVFFYFYLDFGILGVFFLSFIMGIMFKKSYSNILAYPNLRNCLIFGMLLIAFSKSFVRWEFAKSFYCLSFVYIFIITKHNTYVNK